MGRPAATEGGRTVTIRVRVSTAERAALDQARGHLTLSDYARTRLLPATKPTRPHAWRNTKDGRICERCHWREGQAPETCNADTNRRT